MKGRPVSLLIVVDILVSWSKLTPWSVDFLHRLAHTSHVHDDGKEKSHNSEGRWSEAAGHTQPD